MLNHPQQQLAGSIAAASNLPPGYTTHAAHLAVLATHRLAAYNCKKKHPTHQCPAALLLLHQGLSHPLIGPFMQLSEHQCAANMHLPTWVPTTHLEEDRWGHNHKLMDEELSSPINCTPTTPQECCLTLSSTEGMFLINASVYN